MNKKFIFSFVVIAIFLISNVSSGTAAAQTYAVGDSYTFSISNLTSSLVINGTDYSTPSNNTFGKSNTVTIKNLNSTTVTLDYKYNNVNTTGYSEIDGFATYAYLILLVTGLELAFTTAQYANFSAPDQSATASSNDNSASSTFLPMFASGNTTFYKSLFNTSSESDTTSTTTTPSDYSYSTNTATLENGASGNTYTLAYEISLTKTNTTEKFSYTIDTSFKVVIDLTRNIVTELSYSLNQNLKLDTATKVEKTSVKIVEGSSSSGLPGFEFITVVSVMSIIAALALIQKRRK